jgi:pyrimidine operon attenuation protein/uracil phosphoribosyltransferase
MIKKELLGEHVLHIILNRLAFELVENHRDFSNTVLVGLQPRGGFVLNKLLELLAKQGFDSIENGLLDITFYRDDFRRRESPLAANKTQIDVLLEGKKVVFIDDVLYTGRSVRAALDAIHSFGRPLEIELLVLIDRRFSRQLPIQPDYTGQRVDAISSERVSVEWQEENKKDSVYLLNVPDERA